MIPLAPVVAGVGDVLGPIIVVLVIIVSVIGQIITKLREAQQQAQKQAQRRAQPQRPAGAPVMRQRPAAQKPAAAGPDPLKDEIGEFLRRAAQRRPGSPAQTAARPAASFPPAAPPSAAQPPRPARPKRPPVKAEIVEPRLVQASIAERRIGDKPLGTANLGRDVDLADERMTQHLQSVFDHHVGTLSHAQTEAMALAAAAPTAALGIAAILHDPLALRQAIVLNEILHRPTHRWQ